MIDGRFRSVRRAFFAAVWAFPWAFATIRPRSVRSVFDGRFLFAASAEKRTKPQHLARVLELGLCNFTRGRVL